MPEDVVLDDHGFEVPKDMASKYLAWKSTASEARAGSSEAQWEALLQQAEAAQSRVGGPLPPELVSAVRRGIPTSHRARAWTLLCGAKARMADGHGSYEHLLAAGRRIEDEAASTSSETVAAILRDLHRTFPGHPALTADFLQSVKHVLLAYAARNPEVAYCQGMNFVCAAILMVVPEEEPAFWALCYLAEEVLVDHYVQSMIGHKVDQQVAEQLVEQELPRVSAHLRSLSLSLSFVTSQWFLCLFLNSLPSETVFRVWDLVFCLHPCWMFKISLALVALMEANFLLDASDLGPAVFIMRAVQNHAFDADQLLAICDQRFSGITNEGIEGSRREWRRTTMEALQAKLRVREMHESSTQDFRFGHLQARSLLIALRLDGSERNRQVSEGELYESLGRVLPDYECSIVLSFLKECSKDHSRNLAKRSDSRVSIGSSSDTSGSEAGASYNSLPALVSDADDSLQIRGQQLAVGVAVLCEGEIGPRLALCYEAFDGSGGGAMSRAELIALLQAVYKTYYKQPPSEREVRAFADSVFMYEAGQLLPALTLERFVREGATQQTLSACFSQRRHVLCTPRSVNQRRAYLQHELHNDPLHSMLGAIPNFPGCLGRPVRAVGRRPPSLPAPKPVNPTTLRPSAAPPADLLRGKDVVPGQSQLGSLASSFGLLGQGAATLLSDVLGGALDGALGVMRVPLKRNPLGASIADADETATALAKAGLVPPKLTIAVGIDCSTIHLSPSRPSSSGQPLNTSPPELGPNPTPCQLALFTLGKALEAVGVHASTKVRCFSFNAAPPEVDQSKEAAWVDTIGQLRAAAVAASILLPEGETPQDTPPVESNGMEGALLYYDQLPRHRSGGANGSSAAGFTHAVRYATALAQDAADARGGSTLSLVILITPGQAIDGASARLALRQAFNSPTPLSVLALGVGDGPFHELGRLSAASPEIMNAVDFHAAIDCKFPDRHLAVEAFRVLPEQAELAGARASLFRVATSQHVR
ncbi:hypothetical protein AB1Y20_011645 [Prymnesium parvum]|uniref:Rab-GAP TBC domain-containing protein n=1 Tax=Prymnesium parvum TaxID=97485 RepID=A0AB34IJN8_PRYPA